MHSILTDLSSGSNINANNNNQQSRRRSNNNKQQPDSGVDDVTELDNDYKDVFMRRLASDMEQEGIPANDLRRRFGLTKQSLDTLLPEYKLLLHRFDVNLYRHAQEVLTARHLQQMHIGSDNIIHTSSSSHKLVEVEAEPADAEHQRLAAHGQRWLDVQSQRLHKANRSQLDSVLESIRTEDRPVLAFPDGQQPQQPPSADSTDAAQEGDSV